MEIRLAEDLDHTYLVREYLQHFSPDFGEAKRYAECNLLWDRTLVIEEDGLILGTLSWGVREAIQSGIAQLTGLRIIPSRRRQGLGTRLLEAGFADMSAYFTARSTRLRQVYAFAPGDVLALPFLLKQQGFAPVIHLDNWREEGRTDWLYIHTCNELASCLGALDLGEAGTCLEP
ncbi:GNAT family N-acetyltransferase [Tumebacillus permanentifrigoris]|uniref:Acetyltransferase (GNAT) family protein n=1 Tax=Tumebacillus permanentifrigoris TaxID=378543 RepID=A0A316DQN7_9BACL|nr:GNAT family N-acetyltransferase [Tumebacillus permanentifrigoris]PWK05952.1 acetyltransferase (GNAT) family protein [Tumebacillus permanentifrigoris]